MPLPDYDILRWVWKERDKDTNRPGMIGEMELPIEAQGYWTPLVHARRIWDKPRRAGNADE